MVKDELTDKGDTFSRQAEPSNSSEEATVRSASQVFDSLDYPLFILDKSFTILSCNPASAEFFGMSQAEIVGKRCCELVHESGQPHPDCPYKRSKKSLRKESMLMEVKDRLYQVTVNPLLEKGVFKGAVHSIVDVTAVKKAEDQKKQLESDFGKTLKALPSHIFRFRKDENDNIISVLSEGVIAEKFRITSSVIKGKKLDEIFTSPENAAKIRPQYERAFAGENVDFEVELHGVWFRTQIRPFERDLSGKVIEVIGYSEDISSRKKAEQRLKESEEKFRDLAESLPQGVFEIDLKGKVLFMNTAGREFLGYSSEDVENDLNAAMLVIPEHRDAVVNNMKNILSSGRMISYEYTALRKDGAKHPIMIFANPVIRDGRPVGLRGVVVDMTDIKAAEQEKEQAKQYLQNVFNSVSELMISIDKKGIITGWNKAAERITGYKSIDMVGENLFDNPKGLEELAKMMRISLSKAASDFGDTRVNSKDETQKYLLSSTSLLRGGNGKIDGVLLVGRDVSHDQLQYRKLENGSSYLVKDEEKNKVLNSFRSLTAEGYKGIVVTREYPQSFRQAFSDCDILWMTSSKSIDFPTASDKASIMEWLKNKIQEHGKSVVFFDRLDYLLTLEGFEGVIKTIYSINDSIMKTNNIAFVYADSSFVTEQQMKLLSLELRELPFPKKMDVKLSERQLEVLRFINNKNIAFMDVYFKDISKEFNVSKITTKKILSALASKALIRVKKKGRLKALELTEGGKGILT